MMIFCLPELIQPGVKNVPGDFTASVEQLKNETDPSLSSMAHVKNALRCNFILRQFE
jgi:hypothetical protein